MKYAAHFLLVLVAGVVLVGLPFFFGPKVARQVGPLAQQETNVDYERTFQTIAGTIILMVPAYWVFILQRRSGASRYWRTLWTVAWLAFLIHIFWAIRVVMSFGEGGIPPAVDSPQNVEWSNLNAILRRLYESPELVSAPTFDIILLLWWTADVFVSWIPGFNGLGQSPSVTFGAARRADPPPADGMQFVRTQRGILHFVLALAMLAAAIPQGHGMVRVFGFLFGLSIITAWIVRIVRRPFFPESLAGRLFTGSFSLINRLFVWYQLPTWMAVINLGALREVLRAKNLHGTEMVPITNEAGLSPPPPHFESQDLYTARRDGWYNDLAKPEMGSGSITTDPSGDPMVHTHSNPYARFGRNVPLEEAKTDTQNLMNPSPRLISERLLARTKMIEAPTLNLLAAAWIQFQTHDWFNHGEPDEINRHKVPLQAQDKWTDPSTGQKEMLVRSTRPDPTRPDVVPRDNGPRTFVNAETHWWDASQIYGSSSSQEFQMRTNPHTNNLEPFGRLYLENGQLPLDLGSESGMALSGFVGNWWAGLSLLHDVFVKEHNAICSMLHDANPAWPDERVFATARMINGALMAKIHTVEWTTALLQHPALQIGMNANWWGLATEGITRYFGRLGPTEAFGGIPNSGVEHHGAPFTLTEEFAAVYRLHPLIPDHLEVRSIDDSALLERYDIGTGAVGTELQLRNGILNKGRANIWYSFGMQSPGALTLHNYPAFLRRLERTTLGETDPTTNSRRVITETIDLATIDILRDRERGVPRYNQFRRLFHMRPIHSFDAFNHNPYHRNLPQELRDVYGQSNGRDNVHLLDLMVGMFAETPPPGFGISDTAFRVFILMASRRLKSDRYIADGFTEEVFTKEGLNWVNDNSMVSILVRHFPELSGPLYGVGNAFIPWRNVATPVPSNSSESAYHRFS